MARPREYSDDLRQQLLDAAGARWPPRDRRRSSTRRVAAEVGTSTTAIYSLIGSKQELVRQLYLEGFRRLDAHQRAVPLTDDPLADLGALGRAYHQSAIDSPTFYDIMFGSPVPEFEPGPDDAAFALTTLQMCVDAAQRCIDAEVLVGDADDLAHEIWAAVHGVTSLELRHMLGSPDTSLRYLHAVQRAIVDAHRAP